MKRLTIVVLACWLSGGQAPALSAAEGPRLSAREATTTVEPKKSVVETAKESKAKRKGSTTRVITNKDVKKSKGKLIVISTPDSKKDPKAAEKATAETATPVDQEARYRSRTETKELVTAAEKKVSELERAVTDLEQQYYSTNDPTYRDDVIRKRFTQSKRQLDEARQQLADLRDVMQKLDQPVKP